jgi:TonB family protein
MYPVAHAQRGVVHLMTVNLVSIEQGALGGGGSGGGGGLPAKADSKPRRTAPPVIEARVETIPKNDPATQAIFPETIEMENERGVALISASLGSAASVGSEMSGTTGRGSDGTSFGTVSSGTGGDGNGFGSPGTGSGLGIGNGTGSSGSGIPLTQARYRNTPKPNYPENARREGREGSVLLRVLVDEQGRSRKVEIHSSSGSDALDRAAADAIKRWRFHPARYGEQPVESWLRIPIEFRLADKQSW